MQLSEVYLKLGESGFGQLIRGISIGKLKTFQVYEPFKVRAHLAKLNTESLRKATRDSGPDSRSTMRILPGTWGRPYSFRTWI